MVTPDDPTIGVRKAPHLPSVVLPLQRGNVKFLSFGHVNPKALDGAVSNAVFSADSNRAGKRQLSFEAQSRQE